MTLPQLTALVADLAVRVKRLEEERRRPGERPEQYDIHFMSVDELRRYADREGIVYSVTMSNETQDRADLLDAILAHRRQHQATA
jgi:hypothetical protein